MKTTSSNLESVRKLIASTNDSPEATRKRIVVNALKTLEALIVEVEILERVIGIQRSLEQTGRYEDKKQIIH